MFGAIAILILAWLISTVVGEMHTSDYLSTLVAGNIHPGFLPVILFLLASVMAFATGTSWGRSALCCRLPPPWRSKSILH